MRATPSWGNGARRWARFENPIEPTERLFRGEQTVPHMWPMLDFLPPRRSYKPQPQRHVLETERRQHRNPVLSSPHQVSNSSGAVDQWGSLYIAIVPVRPNITVLSNALGKPCERLKFEYPFLYGDRPNAIPMLDTQVRAALLVLLVNGNNSTSKAFFQ